MELTIEEIPENNVETTVPNKVVKKGVHFANDIPLKPTHQPIPKIHAKMNRQQMPQKKSTISYEEILQKMGTFVSDGKLYLVDRTTLREAQSQKREQQNPQQPAQITPQNAYIYNKYFNNEINKEPMFRRPRTLEEYKSMLVHDIIQRRRIKELKSTRLIMPNSNIQFSNMVGYGDLQNKLFNFSKR